MAQRNKFLLGADPELFIIDSKGNAYSAIGVIKGTKENPFPISKHGHSVQVDNVLLEFNVPPADKAKDMHTNINYILKWFETAVPVGCKPHIVSSMRFDKRLLQSDKAKEFGCDPDFDAWREATNESPNPDTNLRVAGGHIHISYPNGNDMDRAIALIKACDLYLGVPSVLFDKDKDRRKMYGKAGAFRFKNYPDGSGGVEYRTLSNFWIKSSWYIEWIYEQVDKALTYINENPEINRDTPIGIDIVNAINNGNEELALNIINKHNITKIPEGLI